METQVYLYVIGEGWKVFALSNTEELKIRGISIGNRASIGDGASIGNGVSVKSIYIKGSMNTVLYWGEDKIQIGCLQKSIDEWINEYEYVGKYQMYSPDAIAEYGKYIQMIKSLHPTMKLSDQLTDK